MRITLELNYCIPNIESDSVTFDEIVGGRKGLTEAEARQSVIEQAKSWAAGQRALALENLNAEFSAWDKEGNNY